MQPERDFLNQQIYLWQQRLKSMPPTTERPASDKLIKAYELRNKVVANLRKQLNEIMDREEANAMIDEAERDAEVWWSMSRGGTIENAKTAC